MLIQDKKIAIVGGGPGGLTLARLLQIRGADITVYERDFNKDARVQGATLDLHTDSGLKALEEAGLLEAFKRAYRPGADKMRITDQHAAILYDQHTDQRPEETFGDTYFRPEIDRGPLRKLLLESLEPGTVVWNSQVQSMSAAGDGWKLHFKNGSTAMADMVIAADGAASKIRPFLTPIKPVYSGVTAVEGNVYAAQTTVPHIYNLLKGGKIFAFGGSKTIIVSSKGDGSLAFYTGCKTDENWATGSGIDFSKPAQVLAWFKQEFGEWDPVWQELFQNGKTAFIPRPLYYMPVDQTWDTLPNLTMLGDAAHLMPPYAGEGVNMAMLDALELTECLTSDAFKDLQTAIAHYEKGMQMRAATAAKMSLENTEWMHAEHAIANMMALFEQ